MKSNTPTQSFFSLEYRLYETKINTEQSILLRWVRNFLVSAENKCLFVGTLSMIITCNIFRGKLTANYRVQEGILQAFITESNFTSIAWLSGTPVFPSVLFSSSRCGKARSFHGVIFLKASSAGAMGARDKKANE